MTLPDIARHWFRQTDKGRGIRLEAEQMDVLNAIGVGQVIAEALAEYQRNQCQRRATKLIYTPEAVTGSNGTGEETEASEPLSSRSSGTIREQDVSANALRLRRTLRQRSKPSTSSTLKRSEGRPSATPAGKRSDQQAATS